AGADLEGQRVILAHNARKVVRGIDQLELGVDIDIAQLRDCDDGSIAITWQVACRQLYRQAVVGAGAELLYRRGPPPGPCSRQRHSRAARAAPRAAYPTHPPAAAELCRRRRPVPR